MSDTSQNRKAPKGMGTNGQDASAPVTVGDLESLVGRLTGEIEALKAQVAGLQAPVAEIPQATEPLSMEISAEEIARALANPTDVEVPESEALEEPEVTPEEIEALTAEIHEKYPEIQEQIDAFNGSPDILALDLDQLEAGATTVVDQTAEVGGTPTTASEIDSLVSQIRDTDDPAAPTLTISEGGNMTDDDVAALIEQVQASDPVTPDNDADGPMSPDEIAAMFAQSEPAAAPETGADGPMSPDEIAAMFAESSPPTQQPMSALEEDGDMAMSLEEIQALVLQSESLQPAAPSTPEAPAENSDLRILGMDDLQNMLDRGVSMTAPSADFVPPEPEVVANVPAGIPMVDESEQFGGFDPPDETISLIEDPDGMPLSATVEWDPEVIAKVPMALAVAAMALPLRWEGEKLVCSVADPVDHEAIGRLSGALHCMIDTRPAPMLEVVRSLREAYRHADATSARLVMDDVARARPGVIQLVHKLWKKVA